MITLNFAANGLGLDNAATPIGLKAMKALQELNPIPNTATNAQILFLVLNASSLTLLPVTIFMYRAQQGAPDPTLVFLPILLATSAGKLSTPWVCMVSISIARAALPENGLTIAVGKASTKRVSRPVQATKWRIPSKPNSSAPEARNTPTAHSIATRSSSSSRILG